MAKKVEDGAIPPLRKREMALGYVTPVVKQGKPIAKLNAAEIEKEAGKWKDALILYVIGETAPIKFLRSYL